MGVGYWSTPVCSGAIFIKENKFKPPVDNVSYKKRKKTKRTPTLFSKGIKMKEGHTPCGFFFIHLVGRRRGDGGISSQNRNPLPQPFSKRIKEKRKKKEERRKKKEGRRKKKKERRKKKEERRKRIFCFKFLTTLPNQFQHVIFSNKNY